MQAAIFTKLSQIASKCKTDDIFIIGKGPSIDELTSVSLPEGVVINLNDSERIRPGHLGVFSANWVRHSLAESGFRCGFYLAGKPLPAGVPHEVLPSLPIELDQEELSILRLERPEFYDEPLVLLNALKLCVKLAEIQGRPQNIYLLGLDFSIQAGSFSAKISKDYSGSVLSERDAIVRSQEFEFRQFLNYFDEKKTLRLIHVGHREFSQLTPATFVRQIQRVGQPVPPPQAASRATHRVQLVAELANNHVGDKARLVEMIERAKEAGADLIKIQKRDVDSFYTKEQLQTYYWSPFGETLRDYRRGVELTDELLDVLDETCRSNQIGWFCSTLDFPSYQALKRFQPRLLKIPSTISNHRDFHRQLAAEYHGDIVVSTGFTGPEYVNYVLDTFSRNEKIYLLHCVSAYPTPLNACNIAVVESYARLARKHPQIIPGYSSHDLGSQGCVLAVASGARMLEKHVKLGEVDWIHFDKVAVDLKTSAFTDFVRDVRLAEDILGSGEKRILECEHHKYTPATNTTE